MTNKTACSNKAFRFEHMLSFGVCLCFKLSTYLCTLLTLDIGAIDEVNIN